MTTELTPEEELALRDIESSSKWDSVTSWLTVLVPCVLLGGIGVWNDSMLIVACAGLTFVLLVTGGLPKQIRRQAHLKSAIQKLKQRETTNQTTKPAEAVDRGFT